MKIFNETVLSATTYFRVELKNVFDSSELDQSLYIVFSHYFNLNRIDLTLNKANIFSESDFKKLKEVIVELKTKKPLAHIIGEWEFCDLSFKVNEHTLIPRPETEELIHLIVKENKSQNNLSILDVGTGSGCIAISLKSFLDNSSVTAYDVSEEALLKAEENAALNNVSIDFQKIDILNWEKQKSSFDVIVSNPPYITENEKEIMHQNVLGFEPHLALFVENETPLIFYIAIANFALEHLKQDGKLYFEINECFGAETKKMLETEGFKNVNIVKDINEKDRIVSCTI
ncbi:peptide chain release factor N(5)-glutamine methyltransferase [Vicingaceae bacterium]|nr:peptide chain release factor N(5)-glutamine methyltransferase [Vicingaceae bacterium]